MAQNPRADPGLDCPLWHKPMEEVCHKCPWWIQLRGTNPNTGAEMDNWGCAVGFLPLLLLENARETRGAAAATEDARNQIAELPHQIFAEVLKGAEYAKRLPSM